MPSLRLLQGMRVSGRLSRLSLGCLLVSSAAGAQFTLYDSDIAHNAATEASAYAAVDPGAPANWKAPEDYAGGIAYFRLQVLEKPGSVGVMAQVCLEQDGRTAGKRACAKDFAFFDKGVYQWSQPLGEFQGAAGMDWTRKPQELVLVLKDCFAKPVTSKAADWVGSPFLTLYYPMRARFTAVVVSKGGTFPGWPVAIFDSRMPAPAPSGLAPSGLVRPDGRATGDFNSPDLPSGFYYFTYKAANRTWARPRVPVR